MSDAQRSELRTVAIPFIIFTAIWGSTWIVIRDGLGVVPAQWSVTYRFVVSAVAMAAVAVAKRDSLRLDGRGLLADGRLTAPGRELTTARPRSPPTPPRSGRTSPATTSPPQRVCSTRSSHEPERSWGDTDERDVTTRGCAQRPAAGRPGRRQRDRRLTGPSNARDVALRHGVQR